MKLFRIFGMTIRDAFKSVFRNFSLSLASISCITITLVIVTISLIASINVNNFADLIKKDVTMVIFLDSDTTQEQESVIREQLLTIDNINEDSIEFQSKGQIKTEMAATDDTLNDIMGSWSEEENPLKDTFLVQVDDINLIHDTAEEVKQIEYVSSVNYGEGMIERLISAFETVQMVSVWVVIALIVVTVFLIVNTIKLTIYSRKREISIMRVVGASNFTIKTPFVVEGMIFGALGSIIPILLTTYGYLAFYNHCDGQLFSPIIKLVSPEPFIYWVSLAVLVIGMIVGMIGSYQAVRKYLKI